MVEDIKTGALVVDEGRQKVGQVMAVVSYINRGRTLVLRPPRGGLEWEQLASKCRYPEPHELVSAQSLTRVEPSA